jgi:DNA-binding transcriptional MerR regulator
MTRSYSSADVCAHTGITYRQLDYWTRSGRISGTDNPGSGYHREYTGEQLLAVGYAASLIEAGFTPGAALTLGQALAAEPAEVISLADGVVEVRIPAELHRQVRRSA